MNFLIVFFLHAYSFVSFFRYTVVACEQVVEK